jgi:hypothetical protein
LTVSQVLGGDEVHRAVIERDQVLRHPLTPLSRRPPPAAFRLFYERLISESTLCQKNFTGSPPPGARHVALFAGIIAAATGHE